MKKNVQVEIVYVNDGYNGPAGFHANNIVII